MSNAKQKKHYNDRCNKDFHGTSSSRLRNRSRSRSRSRECTGKYSTSEYFSRHIKKKPSYQRPKDSDDYYQQTTHKSASNRIKNWKKDKSDERKDESELIELSKSRETETENISNMNKMDKNTNVGILTEAEMNKLGARIIKAEIMGDNVCYYTIIIYCTFKIYYSVYFFIFIRIILSRNWQLSLKCN